MEPSINSKFKANLKTLAYVLAIEHLDTKNVKVISAWSSFLWSGMRRKKWKATKTSTKYNEPLAVILEKTEKIKQPTLSKILISLNNPQTVTFTHFLVFTIRYDVRKTLSTNFEKNSSVNLRSKTDPFSPWYKFSLKTPTVSFTTH